MKTKIILMSMISLNLIMVSQVFGVTINEMERQIREKLTPEEFETIVKEMEASGRSASEIFDDVIDPQREQEKIDDIIRRQYITEPAKSEEPSKNGADAPAKVTAGTGSEDVPAPVSVEEKPIKLKESGSQKHTKIYPSEKNFNDSVAAKRQNPDSPEPAKEGKDENAKTTDKGSADGDHKVKEDKKNPSFRTYERKKKIEDYNRTKKKNKFGTKRLDDDVEDEGFDTKAFKKKEFGSKLISEHKSSKFDGPDKTFEQKGYKRKLIRTGTYTSDKRKISMFGKNEGDESENQDSEE